MAVSGQYVAVSAQVAPGVIGTTQLAPGAAITGRQAAGYQLVVSQPNDESLNGSVTAKEGLRITVGATSVQLISVDVDANCTATVAYLYASDKTTLLATSSAKVGNTMTFPTPYTMIKQTSYAIMVDKGGAAFTATIGGVATWNAPDFNTNYSAYIVGSVFNDITNDSRPRSVRNFLTSF